MEEGGGAGGGGGGGGGGAGEGLGGVVRSEKSNHSKQSIQARAVLASNPRSLFSLKSERIIKICLLRFSPLDTFNLP